MKRKKTNKKIQVRFEKWTQDTTRWIGSKESVVFHTIFFIAMFMLALLGIKLDTVLLILTTVVSLEAIYLAIFIQMTVNKNTADIEDIQEDVEEIQEDVEEIQEDVEGIEKDVDEIQGDVDEIQKDVDEIQEDVEEVTEDIDVIESGLNSQKPHSKKTSSDNDHDRLAKIESTLEHLLEEIRNNKNPQ